MYSKIRLQIGVSVLSQYSFVYISTTESCPRIRESVTAKIMHCFHVSGKINISDVLTKLLPHSVLHDLVRPVLFWQGDTKECGSINIHVHDKKYTLEQIDVPEIHIGECEVVTNATVGTDFNHTSCESSPTALGQLGQAQNSPRAKHDPRMSSHH